MSKIEVTITIETKEINRVIRVGVFKIRCLTALNILSLGLFMSALERKAAHITDVRVKKVEALIKAL